ncbi:hypothetical protein HanIR_Chr03g0100751 [Helianthus annuus]|nr:hypothetical protein HanIR_Chr03g0100751 [Helianthus annuus]
MSNSAMKKKELKIAEEKWTTFDDIEDDENCHPNLFADQAQVTSGSQKEDRSVRVSKVRNSSDRLFKNNPFFDY